jgi:hypothetical protein
MGPTFRAKLLLLHVVELPTYALRGVLLILSFP